MASEPIEGSERRASHEAIVYVGEVHEGVLHKVNEEGPLLRTDYTVEEIEAGRRAYEEAKKALSKRADAIFPFGD